MNEESTQSFLLSNIGLPFLIGLVVGYIAKKALKAALFIGGLAVGAYLVSEYYGFTTISHETLSTTSDIILGQLKDLGGFLKDRIGHLMSKGGSAIVGFAIGLQLG
jgi:uncharacterized membrane protein (Fun14 family)